MRMPKTSSFLLPLVFLSLLSVVAPAQGRQPLNLSFGHAVELALKTYPAIRAAQAQQQAAEAGVDLARANYLPRVDMAWQQKRATPNTLFCLFLPRAGIPSIYGL